MELLALLVRLARTELVSPSTAQAQVQAEVQEPREAAQIMGPMMDLPLQVVATGTATTQAGKDRTAEIPRMGPLLTTALLAMGHRLAVHKDKALVVMVQGILAQDLALVVVLDLEMAPAQAQAQVPAVALLAAQMTVEAQVLGRVQEAEMARATDQIQDQIHPQAVVQVLDLREVVVQDQMVEMATVMALDPGPTLAHHHAMVQMAVEMVHQQHVNQHLRPDHRVMFLVVVILIPTIPLVLLIQSQMADRPRVHKLEPVQAKLVAKEMDLEVMDLEATTGLAVGRNQRPLRIRLGVQREVVQVAMATLPRATLCPMAAQRQHRELLYPAVLRLQGQVDRELRAQQARHRQPPSYLMGHQLSILAQAQQTRHCQLPSYPMGHQLSILAQVQRGHLEDW
jgi:hypothetical protein